VPLLERKPSGISIPNRWRIRGHIVPVNISWRVAGAPSHRPFGGLAPHHDPGDHAFARDVAGLPACGLVSG
jgi:hypothetical protein